jgi:hypothetical protein
MGFDTKPGKCLNCKAEVQVPNTFADGEQIDCAVCGIALKILRPGGGLRLVIADLTPFRDEMRAKQQQIKDLEHDLAKARASFGIGANGLGLGVMYVIARVGLEEKPLTSGLIAIGVAIALVTGIALEVANLLFLAKRRDMTRLAEEITQAQAELKETQRKIKDSLVKR